MKGIDVHIGELLKRAIKYLIEGLMVAIAAFAIPKKNHSRISRGEHEQIQVTVAIQIMRKYARRIAFEAFKLDFLRLDKVSFSFGYESAERIVVAFFGYQQNFIQSIDVQIGANGSYGIVFES